MYLKHLQLTNFKNRENGEFDFNEKVNAIVGKNGCGKTNLLDAIYYLSFCKSYFSHQDSISIKFDADFFAIHGDYLNFSNQNHNHISCTYRQQGRKVMKINQKEYERFSDHIGLYPIVMVSPYDQDIINSGSDLRRKFFDMIISQFDKSYLQQLISYQKLIAQRNSLLKQFIENQYYEPSLVQIFDEQLLPLALYIHQKRKNFIQLNTPIFQSHYKMLSENSEPVSIDYESGMNTISFDEGLKKNEFTDRKLGYTTFGPHKDDYLFNIDNHPIKRFGSQGQQKSYILALKLAQFDFIFQEKKIKPILLLDDIFDKLDHYRITQLLNLVGEKHFGQVFITDTDENRVKDILEKHKIEHKIFTL